MADETTENRIETLAMKLLAEPGNGVDDIESARLAAQRSLEDSETRTFDPATTDPHLTTVVRRDSEETAASGDDDIS